LVNGAFGLTIDELASRCAEIERGIRDLSWEEEWIYENPDLQGLDSQAIGPTYRKARVCISFSPQGTGTTDYNSIHFDRYMWEEKGQARILATGQVQEVLMCEACDGQQLKALRKVNGRFRGEVVKAQPGIVPKPFGTMGVVQIGLLGASIYRTRVFGGTEFMPLSYLVSKYGRLDDQVIKDGDFNVVRVDFVQPQSGYIILRAYFSVDHDYYPVKYEHMTGGPAELNRVGYTVVVTSLQEVLPQIWFPTNAIFIGDPKVTDIHRAIGKIKINQGLSEKDFDLEFPAGTMVVDKIKGRKYIVASGSGGK